MKRSVVGLVFLLMSLAVTARALELELPGTPDCGYIRLDQPYLRPDGFVELGNQSMARIDAIDQKSLNVCYSAVAAQMADAWRFSHGDTDYGKRTSYVAAAIDTGADPDLVLNFGHGVQTDMRRTSIDFGHVIDVLKYLRKGRACDASALAKGVGVTDQGALLAELGRAYGQHKVWTVFSALAKGFGKRGLASDRVARRHYAEAAVSCMRHLGFSKDQIPQIAELEVVIATSNPLLFLQKQVDSACAKSRFKPGIPKPVELESKDPDALRKRVDLLLGRKNAQPIAVSFCGNILQQGKSYKSACWGHASLIIGRRFNAATKSCELLVRNSWGTSCGLYANDSGYTCEEGKGSLWIPADVLLKNTTKLTNLE